MGTTFQHFNSLTLILPLIKRKKKGSTKKERKINPLFVSNVLNQYSWLTGRRLSTTIVVPSSTTSIDSAKKKKIKD
jgi:hypothetical protein